VTKTDADAAKIGLPEKLIAPLQRVLRGYPEVRQALLFGSRAKGTNRANSDIDLCLIAPDLAFTDYLQLAATLDEQLLPYSLDLVLQHHIDNPALLEHIQRVGVVAYQSNTDATPST